MNRFLSIPSSIVRLSRSCLLRSPNRIPYPFAPLLKSKIPSRMSSSKPAPPQTTKNGSCLCKKVQYTVTGQDRGAVICHCVNCQKGTGSAFAHNHQITKAQLEVKSGKVSRRKRGLLMQNFKGASSRTTI